MYSLRLVVRSWLAVLLLFSPALRAQQAAPVATAVATPPLPSPFLWRTLAVMTGGQRVQSVTVSGDITIYGSSANTDSTFSFSANDSGESQLSIGTGVGESRTVSGGVPSGNGIGPGGVSYPISAQNPMNTSAWFFSELNIAARLVAKNYAKVYVGRETKDGHTVNHLQLWEQANGATSTAAAAVKALSLEDVYVDEMSHLPIAVAFSLHVAGANPSNIPVEVHLSNYQSVQNCSVAHSIQVDMLGLPFWGVQFSSVALSFVNASSQPQ